MNKTTIQKTFSALAAVALSTVSALAAGTDTWVGNTDANWSTAGNWSTVGGSTPPANGDSLVFGAAGAYAPNNNISGLSVNNFIFNSGASAFTFSGNSFTLTGNLTNNAAGETLNGIAIGAGIVTTIKNLGSGTLTLGALTESGGGTVLFTTTSPISTSTADQSYQGGNLLGGWAVIDNGNNTYDWAHSGSSGVNNITAPTYVAPSTAELGNVKCTSTVTLGNSQHAWLSILVSGATLNYGAWNLYLTSGGLILENGGIYTGSGELICNNSANSFFVHVPDTGTIGAAMYNGSSATTLYKDGPGTLTLNAAINKNTYTGGTKVYQGALNLANGGQQGEIRGALTIYPGATVNLNAGDALGWDTVASGTTVPTVNIVGGTLNNAGNQNNGYATTFNLTGGVMTNSVANTGTFGFNFNGSSGAINSLATNIVSTIYAPIALRADGLAINTAQGTVPGGIDLNIKGAIVPSGGTNWTKAGAGTLQLSGANTFAGTLTISAGTLQLGAGGSLGNTAIAFSGAGTFAVKPGSSTTINAGTTVAGSAGATLNLGGQTFDMGDSATSTFNLQQQTSFGSTALTIANGATLKFDLGGSTTAADLLAVTKAASVSGTVNVTVNTIGSTALSAGTYNIITAASGLSGTWQFTGGGTKQTVTLGGTRSNIHLNNASTAVSLTVANAYTVTYNGNGSDGGSVPTDSNSPYDSGASVTVAAVGSLTKTGYTFNGWNTQANGSGTAYSGGGSFSISSDTTLYAQWQAATATITAPSTFPGAVSTTYGTASSPQSVAVSGANLTANITASVATSGLQISSDGSTWGTTATFTQTGGSASGTLYVRLATNAPVSGSYNSQLVSLASTGASTVNVATTASGNTVGAKALTVTGAAAQSKLYDTTTAATLTGTLSGVVNSDNVTLNLSGTFSSSAVGGPYTVTSTSTLGGTAAGNYTLTQPTGLTASILSSAVWNNTAGGLWGTAGNWLDSVIGTGSGVTADFSQVDITADTTVNLDSAQIIGNLIFGDTDTSTAASWTLANNATPANTLTLAGTTPTVTVNALGTGKSATISAIVAGTSGLTKTGNGTLTLAGANTYSGGTTISGGTLALTGNGAIPSTSQPLLIGTVAGTPAAVYQSGASTAISAGGASQLGSVAGASGYYNLSAGTLTIQNGGELDPAGSGGGAGTFGQFDMSGGIVNVGTSGTGSTFFLPCRAGVSGESSVVNFSGGAFTVFNGMSDTIYDGYAANWNAGGQTNVTTISGSALFQSLTASVKLNFANNSGNVGIFNLNGGTWQMLGLNNTRNANVSVNFNGGTVKAANSANTTFLGNSASATVYAGGGTVDNNGQAITITQQILVPAGNGVSTIPVSVGGAGYVIPPQVVITGGGGSGATAYAQIGGGAVTSITVTCPGNNYFSTPTVTLVGGGYTSAATIGTVTTAANISGGMTFQGAGTNTLSGANTYTGNTTVAAGTAKFGNASAFGTGTVTLNGGTIQAGGAFTLANNLIVSSSATFDIAGNNTTVSGNLGGSAALNFNNSGVAATVTLNGNSSSYGGTFTLNNNNAASFSSANAGGASAAWVFNDSAADRVRINIGNGTINFGSISGSGQLQNDTLGTASTISVGALNTSTTFSGTIKDNGTGTLALTKVGSGALTLSGGNTYTGNTTINAGTLALGSSGSIANSANIIVNGALDVSGVTTAPYHFVSGQTLKGSGGTITGGLTLDSGASLGFTYSGSPLLTSANGTLTMNNNAASITYSGSPLTPGNYKLISAGTGGSVSGDVSSSVVTYTAAGAIGAHTSSLSINGSELYLTVNNRAPSASDISMGAIGGVASTLQIIGGKHPPTDPDGDAVNTIASVTTPTSGHATATISGNNIIYTPDSSYAGSDSFTYTVSDIYGGTSAAATVSVNVQSGTGIGQQAGITMIGGSAALKFWGVPGQTYTIQRSTTSVNGPWDDLGTAVANDVGTQPIGQINYTDTAAPTGSAYYRLKP